MRRSIFSVLLWKSLSQRRARSAITLGALLLGACMVGALLSISMDVGRNAGAQLEAYGANMLLLPKGGVRVSQDGDSSYLTEAGLAILESHRAGGLYFSPYLYSMVEANGQKVVLGGMRTQAGSPLASWWRVEGLWPDSAGPEAALVGVAASRALGVSPGDGLTVQHRDSSLRLRVSGIVETGGSEDSQVLTHLPAVQRLISRDDAVSLVQIRAQAGANLEALGRQIEDSVPGVEARIVGQVAQAEMQVLGKVELLMAVVALLVLVASSLSVSSTLTAAVLERTREIGLMKALGARDLSVIALLLTEVLILGVTGGLLGYALGLGLAEFIAYSVFSSTISPNPAAFGLTLALAVVVALMCCIIPVRRALAVDPAITLKGE